MNLRFSNPFDGLVLFNAVAGLLLFIGFHLATYRLISAGNVLKWLKQIFVPGALLNLVLSGIFFFRDSASVGGPDRSAMVLCTLLSLAVYAMVTFLYVLCLFGPHESSIRIRIIRELDKFYPNACPENVLRGAYNAQIILQRRLDRLMSAGDITFDGKRYRLQKKCNFFMLSDRIAKVLYRLMGEK